MRYEKQSERNVKNKKNIKINRPTSFAWKMNEKSFSEFKFFWSWRKRLESWLWINFLFLFCCWKWNFFLLLPIWCFEINLMLSFDAPENGGNYYNTNWVKSIFPFFPFLFCLLKIPRISKLQWSPSDYQTVEQFKLLQ